MSKTQISYRKVSWDWCGFYDITYCVPGDTFSLGTKDLIHLLDYRLFELNCPPQQPCVVRLDAHI